MAQRHQQPYWDTLTALRSRYPAINSLQNGVRHWHPQRGRASVLEFYPGEVRSRDFEDVQDLQHYFHHVPHSRCENRLYLLEDLTLDYIEAFGSQFWIDPYLFAAQSWAYHWAGNQYASMPRRLPSEQDPKRLFTLRYFEVRRFRHAQIINYEKVKTDSNMHRFIEQDMLDPHPDGLMLLEPPLKLQGSYASFEHEPYQLGYHDFSPWSTTLMPDGLSRDRMRGPSREAMLDDIEFYWTRMATTEQINAAIHDRMQAAQFLKKAVAAYWDVYLQYLLKRLSICEIKFWDFESRDDKSPHKALRPIYATLQNANQWRRRLGWSSSELEVTLNSLGVIPIQGDSAVQTVDGDLDLLAAYHRLNAMKDRFTAIIDVAVGTLSFIQGQLAAEETETSLKEATLSRKLTFLGLIFVPIAFSASLFSMAGNYQPGGSLFWVYLVVAVVATIVTFLVFFLFTFTPLERLFHLNGVGNDRAKQRRP